MRGRSSARAWNRRETYTASRPPPSSRTNTSPVPPMPAPPPTALFESRRVRLQRRVRCQRQGDAPPRSCRLGRRARAPSPVQPSRRSGTTARRPAMRSTATKGARQPRPPQANSGEYGAASRSSAVDARNWPSSTADHRSPVDVELADRLSRRRCVAPCPTGTCRRGPSESAGGCAGPSSRPSGGRRDLHGRAGHRRSRCSVAAEAAEHRAEMVAPRTWWRTPRTSPNVEARKGGSDCLRMGRVGRRVATV